MLRSDRAIISTSQVASLWRLTLSLVVCCVACHSLHPSLHRFVEWRIVLNLKYFAQEYQSSKEAASFTSLFSYLPTSFSDLTMAAGHQLRHLLGVQASIREKVNRIVPPQKPSVGFAGKSIQQTIKSHQRGPGLFNYQSIRVEDSLTGVSASQSHEF